MRNLHYEIVKIEALIIETSNIQKLAQFYQDSLEIDEIKWISDTHCGVYLENTYLGFDHVESPKFKGGNTILWFEAEHVQVQFDRFLQFGAKILYEPDDQRSPGEILAEVLDPDGNRIGIIGPIK